MNIFQYLSYEDLKTYQDVDVTSDDVLLKEMVRTASLMWDGSTGRHFAPWKETRYYDYEDTKGDALRMSARARQAYFTDRWASILKLDEDLLDVVTLTTANGDTTISDDDYLLRRGKRYGTTPYDRIELKVNATTSVFSFSGTYQQANAVTGIWGYHDDYASAWQDSDDSVQDTGGIDASTASITVSDVDGADLFGLTPRFKVGDLVKIEDEYCYVTAKDTSTNKLTVIRGVNGTTAATHDKSTTIYVWQTMRDVWHTVRRLAVWLYGQKDSPFFETQISPQMGTITIPPTAPADVLAKVAYYRRV